MTTADEVFELLKSRRVVRTFTPEPVTDGMLERVAHAARWASSAGNRHVHKFLIVRDPERIRLIRSFAPGMLTEPPALIAILTDFEAMRRENVRTEGDDANSVDVGTAVQSMMTMAHAMGLGSCPVTSFSKSGVAGVLGLPDHLRPELILIIGHPKPVERSMRSNAPKPLRARDLVFWEQAGAHDPA